MAIFTFKGKPFNLSLLPVFNKGCSITIYSCFDRCCPNFAVEWTMHEASVLRLQSISEIGLEECLFLPFFKYSRMWQRHFKCKTSSIIYHCCLHPVGRYSVCIHQDKHKQAFLILLTINEGLLTKKTLTLLDAVLLVDFRDIPNIELLHTSRF